MRAIEIDQIIVVTDGRSNIGGNPETAAAEAFENGLIVNTIGIVEDLQKDETVDEVQQIARAGNGIWEYTTVGHLGRTMMGVTQKTVNKTIQTLVGNQLREIIGSGIEDIPPEKRNKIVQYMDELSEDARIRCCILMDCSGSMANKMNVAKQSVIELMNSLQGRTGKSKVALIAFPGDKGQPTKVIHSFTDDIKEIKSHIFELKAGGTTPTAAAINKAVRLFQEKEEIQEIIINSEPLLKNSMI